MGSLKLQEIIQMRPIRPVPQAPEFVKGVIDFRGRRIPVIDVRLKLGMTPKDYTVNTLIAVLEAETGSGIVWIGIVADSISGLSRMKDKCEKGMIPEEAEAPTEK
jgi:purine-binding chemotaxis protein CheW